MNKEEMWKGGSMRGRDDLGKRVRYRDNEGRCVIQKAAIIMAVKEIMSSI